MNDNLFREILNQEIRKYDEKTGKETQELIEENKIFEKALSLDFMYSDSLQTNVSKLLVKQVKKSIASKLNDIPNMNGLVPLTNGGSNNAV